MDTLGVDNCKQPYEESETRPKVNPIFLWALQREQKIVEVRCEDYDKRNRIKLTKTPFGWRSIPRTSSSIYNSCRCSSSGSNYSVNKDKPASSSPSITSSCVPCSMSLKSSSSSPSSYSESTSFSSRSSTSYMPSKNKDTCVVPEVRRKESKRCLAVRSHYHDRVSDDESDATRSSCRNSRISFDLSYDDHNHEEETDDRDDDYEERERFDDHDVHDGDYEYEDTQHENSKFLTLSCGRTTLGLIDLEEVQKDSLLQPRVVLEPLNPARYRFSSLIENSKLNDDIEMVVEDDEVVDQQIESVKDINKDNKNKNNTEGGKIDVNSVSVSVVRAEDTEEEIEEIEDDIKDNEELDDENATVFEYDDRDSVEMMDDEELHERDDDVLGPDDKLPETGFYQVARNVPTNKVPETCLEDDIVEEDIDEVQEDVKIINHKPRVPGSIPLPDLKPINDSLDKPRFPKTLQITRTCSQQVPPSPPCSVTCSEDASRPDLVRNVMPSVPEKRRREAPDLIEVKPTEWRRREAPKPANQLRELIRKSGGSIPDPLLVPRDRLSSLAAAPAIEIPRLLITRPELRLPEALSHPELLSDPDILVISLSHLQQVLDAVPDSRYRVPEDKNIKADNRYQQGYQQQLQNHQHSYSSSSSSSNINNNNKNQNSYSSLPTNSEKKRLSCKPIGSLMPAPMDLSRHSSSSVTPGQNSILRVRSGLLRQESEVTSTARIPGDDSRLWHPLFGCRYYYYYSLSLLQLITVITGLSICLYNNLQSILL